MLLSLGNRIQGCEGSRVQVFALSIILREINRFHSTPQILGPLDPKPFIERPTSNVELSIFNVGSDWTLSISMSEAHSSLEVGRRALNGSIFNERTKKLDPTNPWVLNIIPTPIDDSIFIFLFNIRCSTFDVQRSYLRFNDCNSTLRSISTFHSTPRILGLLNPQDHADVLTMTSLDTDRHRS